ncbi:TM2 domain-containing protein [Senegalimassilia anaerobia]
MDPMNERSAADELAAAEAELKAAQERLDAARLRMTSEQPQPYAQPADAPVDSQGAQSQPQPYAQAQQVPYVAQPAQPASFGSQPQSQQPYGAQPGYGSVPPQNPYGQQAQYGYQQPYVAPAVGEKDHVAAGLLALFLGWLGVHKFYLGYNTSGFIMLGTSILGGILTLSVASWAIWVIAIVEGIFYLSKSQTEFEQMYVINKREWF